MYNFKIEEKYFEKIMETLKNAKHINEMAKIEDRVLNQTIAICWQQYYKNEREK